MSERICEREYCVITRPISYLNIWLIWKRFAWNPSQSRELRISISNWSRDTKKACIKYVLWSYQKVWQFLKCISKRSKNISCLTVSYYCHMCLQKLWTLFDYSWQAYKHKLARIKKFIHSNFNSRQIFWSTLNKLTLVE